MSLSRLPPPTAIVALLVVLAVFYFAEQIGQAMGGFSIYSWFWFNPVSIRQGELWRLLTHAVLPGGLLDLVLNGIIILWIGSRVARVWSRAEFFLYCGICASGAGVVGCVISPTSGSAVLGGTVLVIALLVPWARMFGHERLWVMALGNVTLFTMAVVFGLVLVLFSVTFGGWRYGLFILSSAGFGWLYLSLRWRATQAQPARTINSSRINQLEL